MDIKDKITKLLALAESPSEYEAQSALLKARQLMAEHKLCESEIRNAKNNSVIQELSGITYSERKNAWVLGLSIVIGEHYCCKSYSLKQYGKQMAEVGFIGLKNDFELCTAIFKYAYSCVDNKCKELRKEHKHHSTSAYIAEITEAYGRGFVQGLNALYEKQSQEHQEYALILTIPTEVQNIVEKMQKRKFIPKFADNLIYRNAGIADGLKFDPSTKLDSVQDAPTNIFWGFEPQADGSYCNIKTDTGIIRYVAPSVPPVPNEQCITYKLSEAVCRYSNLDPMVQKTIDKFAKKHPQLFNQLINQI